MSEPERRPILTLLTSHWISKIGVALVTLAGFSWLFVLPAHLRGHVDNPYIGVLVFVFIPIIFFAGLALIPIGVFLAKRQIAAGLVAIEDRRSAARRLAMFLLTTTVINVIIASQVSYRAVEHLETGQFCGATCHVMAPEMAAHQVDRHRELACVACHVGPGAGGFIEAKIAGNRQLREVVMNSHPRPIPSAMETNRLASSAETCERCHSRTVVTAPRLRVITRYKDDETNTKSSTVLMMMIGGNRSGGIHGAHTGPGVSIRYAASDKKRQNIPWVEYSNSVTGARYEYFGDNAKPEAVRGLPTFRMQCVDCHNRAAHAFERAADAVDTAMARGGIPAALPFVKKQAVELLQAAYANETDAASKIPEGLKNFYREKYPAANADGVKRSGEALVAIWRRNVFPDLKVTWGTYVNNFGHGDEPGCFRCHDGSHNTVSGNAANPVRTISQDCSVCHQALAVDEASPEILKNLNIAEAFQRQ